MPSASTATAPISEALIREGTDIVFANEKEITSLYEVNSFAEAADAALADCELAVLTRSERRLGDRGRWRDHRHRA